MSLDRFVPSPLARERHEVTVHAPADITWAVARDFDLFSLRLVRGIFRLRALAMRGAWPPPPSRGLVRDMLAMGWGVLEEVPARLLVAGAACQPWLGDVAFVALPPGDFAAWAKPAMVKIAWTIETTPVGPTRTSLGTERRVAATDAEAGWRFGRYWMLVRPGIVLIRHLLLRAIRREAEGRWMQLCRQSMRENAVAPDEALATFAEAADAW